MGKINSPVTKACRGNPSICRRLGFATPPANLKGAPSLALRRKAGLLTSAVHQCVANRSGIQLAELNGRDGQISRALYQSKLT